MEEIKCIGCGANLQCEDEKKPGYVLPSVLSRLDLEGVVCSRCHKIKNYNLITKNELSTEEYYKIIKKIAHEAKTKILFHDFNIHLFP